VPFGLRNLKEDLEDVGSNFDGAPDLSSASQARRSSSSGPAFIINIVSHSDE
jgi:hypothetical protein